MHYRKTPTLDLFAGEAKGIACASGTLSYCLSRFCDRDVQDAGYITALRYEDLLS